MKILLVAMVLALGVVVAAPVWSPANAAGGAMDPNGAP